MRLILAHGAPVEHREQQLTARMELLAEIGCCLHDWLRFNPHLP